MRLLVAALSVFFAPVVVRPKTQEDPSGWAGPKESGDKSPHSKGSFLEFLPLTLALSVCGRGGAAVGTLRYLRADP